MFGGMQGSILEVDLTALLLAVVVVLALLLVVLVVFNETGTPLSVPYVAAMAGSPEKLASLSFGYYDEACTAALRRLETRGHESDQHLVGRIHLLMHDRALLAEPFEFSDGFKDLPDLFGDAQEALIKAAARPDSLEAAHTAQLPEVVQALRTYTYSRPDTSRLADAHADVHAFIGSSELPARVRHYAKGTLKNVSGNALKALSAVWGTAADGGPDYCNLVVEILAECWEQGLQTLELVCEVGIESRLLSIMPALSNI